jgi:hypothetical protein
MYHYEILIAVAVVLMLVVGPLVLGLKGLNSARRLSAGAPAEAVSAWDWKLAITSALLYALAFNLTFFIQELFLVLPKALTPGLRPILFHNNHRWRVRTRWRVYFKVQVRWPFLSPLLSVLCC